MGSLTKTQLAALAGALFLIICLFLLPGRSGESPAKEEILVGKTTHSKTKHRIEEAVKIVTEGNEPMKGIMMLREVLKEEPENATAHFYLGIFSVQSGQYEKAVDRFSKVLELAPDNKQAFFYLGRAYSGLNEKDQAIEYFETYKSLISDTAAIADVDKYINELKN